MASRSRNLRGQTADKGVARIVISTHGPGIKVKREVFAKSDVSPSFFTAGYNTM